MEGGPDFQRLDVKVGLIETIKEHHTASLPPPPSLATTFGRLVND
jgi:hypothetical protein